MRARTTWNMSEILNRTAATSPTAATNRTADPYAMNQDHLKQQPPADKYLTGDPSAFAEDITTPNNWEVEYSGGAVKRDEIGLAEDRPDTFNHPEKTASMNHDVLLKKADLTVRIARRMLGANAPEGAVEEQAASLMHLPDAEVINTYNRLANGMPPQLQKAQEQKQEAAKEEQAAEEQCKQAAIRGDKKAFDAALAKLMTLRKANDPQQGQPQQQQAGQQQQQAGQQQQGQAQQQQAGQDQQSAWYDTKAPRPGHPGPDNGPYAGQQQQAQGQQVPPPAFQQAQVQQQGTSGEQMFPGGQTWGDGGHTWAGQGQQMPPQQQAGLQNPQVPSPNLQQAQQAPMQQQAQGQQQGVEAQVQAMIEQAAQQMGKQANGQQQPMQQQAQGQQPQMQQQAQGQQAPMQQQGQGQQQAPMQQQGGQGQQQPMQQQGAGYQQAQQQAPMQQQGQGQQPQMQQQAGAAPGLTNPNHNLSPNTGFAGQQVQASDDQLLDQMLMGDAAGAPAAGNPIAEMDIQMDAPSMDIGEVQFQPGEDAMLRQLFSNDEAMAAQQVQDQQQGQQGQQQVQASNVRTAALRTVGTRPTAGVARIGGAGAPPARGQEVDKLTSLWQSAPDVREVFGLK